MGYEKKPLLSFKSIVIYCCYVNGHVPHTYGKFPIECQTKPLDRTLRYRINNLFSKMSSRVAVKDLIDVIWNAKFLHIIYEYWL